MLSYQRRKAAHRASEGAKTARAFVPREAPTCGQWQPPGNYPVGPAEANFFELPGHRASVDSADDERVPCTSIEQARAIAAEKIAVLSHRKR